MQVRVKAGRLPADGWAGKERRGALWGPGKTHKAHVPPRAAFNNGELLLGRHDSRQPTCPLASTTRWRQPVCALVNLVTAHPLG